MSSQLHWLRSRLVGHRVLLALLPALLLGAWAFLVLRQAHAANSGLGHCSTWNQGIHRFQEAFSNFHGRASGLLGAASIPTEVAAVEALLPPIQDERKALAHLEQDGRDPRLEAVDLALAGYMAQWNALAKSSQGTSTTAIDPRVEAAHLEHRRQEVVSALKALDDWHREGLDGSIQAARAGTDRMVTFSMGALVIALGFGVTAGLALRARQASAGQARLSRALMDAMPEAILAWNSQGQVKWTNAAWWEMSGQDPRANTSIGHMLPEGIPDRLLRNDGGQLSFNLVHQDGRMLAILGRARQIPMEDTVWTLAVLKDTSHETTGERHRREEARYAQLGRDLVIKARDLARLLNPLILGIDILRQKGGPLDFNDPSWRRLEQEANAAARLLADISRYALSEGLQDHHELFDVNLCVQEAAEATLRGGHSLHALNLDLSMEPALAMGPRSAFQECVDLLIRRALAVSPSEVPVQLKTQVESGRFLLEVSDGGQAIDPSHADRVFEPSYQALPNAHEEAMGLYNVAETLKAMEGEARLLLTNEGLTCFQILVPIERDL